MSKFASDTQVPVERSRGEIEKTLARYGADQFMYGWKEDRAVIGFRAHDRMVRFELPMPEKNDRKYDQLVRQRWRILLLVVKAKLEAVDSNVSTFEDEFLAHIVLASGETLGAWIRPQLDSHYKTGKMPPLLGSGR